MPEVWIAVVGVLPMTHDTCLGLAKGAYVNALAYVSTAAEYERAVTTAFRELDLHVFELEDVEPFRERSAKYVLDKSIRALAKRTHRTHAVMFDEFHVFKSVDG
jgi:hypothetical protein